MKYEELRQHQYCCFDGMTIDENTTEVVVTYSFTIDKLDTFETKWTFLKKDIPYFDKEDLKCKRMLFDLGMVELISYYKLTCAKEIIVKESMNDSQKAFYQKLIYNGLGEFMYKNDIHISQDDLCFITSNDEEFKQISSNDSLHGILLPIGGGKDSITSLEILKKSGISIVPYMINGRGATIKTCEVGKVSKYINVKRVLDKKILDYNKQGYLNGHIPFSSVVAFSALFVASCAHLEMICLSNEDSANEATVRGMHVNHQYSKSFEFEKDFREYVEKEYTCAPSYFSLLRPFSEYQIGKYFSKCKEYHSIFKSCNLGSKEDKWCNNCPKCLYVYILLSAFLQNSELETIFHENLLERQDLLETFYELIGLGETKPFECVGSVEEINFAIIQAISNYQKANEKLPLMYEEYKKNPIYDEYKLKENPYDTYYVSQHFIPKQLEDLVRKEMLDCD